MKSDTIFTKEKDSVSHGKCRDTDTCATIGVDLIEKEQMKCRYISQKY